jgi:hypothetical protein
MKYTIMLVPSVCDFIFESDRSGPTPVGVQRFTVQTDAMAQLMAQYTNESVVAMTGVTRQLFTYIYVTYCGHTTPMKRLVHAPLCTDCGRSAATLIDEGCCDL